MGRNLGSTLRSNRLAARIIGVLAFCPASLLAQGIITGTVQDSLGTPLSGAQITLDSSRSRAVTTGSGEFRFVSVPAGNVEVHFRRLGYRPESRTVRVEPGMAARVEVRLVPLPVRLQTVEVRRRAEAFDSRLAGFNARKSRQVGHFVTREQLDRLSSARLVDALGTIPGVQIRPIRGGGTTLALRGSRCPPLVFIDGFPTGAGVMDLDMIDLASVEGLEIYSGVATVPSEFMGARGTHGCGVVAIWSRPARRRQRRGGAESVNLEQLLASRAVYTADQVEEVARIAQESVVPVYPDSLWRAGTSGRVVAEFVVDTAGAIEVGSLRIVSATHPYFAGAVKAALEEGMFRSAVLGGRPVRQIVQLPFVFEPLAIMPGPSRSPLR